MPEGVPIPIDPPFLTPRLARRVIRLEDGHRVGVAIAGRGMPLVVVHGWMAQGLYYAQTMNRLVGMGFKVIAIDAPGHGRTPLPRRFPFTLSAHVDVIERALVALGVRRAILLGHSFGGRIVTELAARQPADVVALVLVDPIVGEDWDRLVGRLRRCPPAAGLLAGRLFYDIVSTLPVLENPRQSLKLASLIASAGGVNPMRFGASALSITVSPPSVPLLDRLGSQRVPCVLIHGSADLTVPVGTALDAARRLHGTLVLVDGARHSWLLRDPETLPSIIGRLLSGTLGDAWVAALHAAGLDPASATTLDIERIFYRHDSLAMALTPPLEFVPSGERLRRARYEFTIEGPGRSLRAVG